MKKISLLLLIGFFIFPDAWSQSQPIAAVYYGPGVCDGCPQSLAKVIRQAGYDVQKIHAGEITQERLKSVNLFAIPGGDDVDELMDDLKPGEAEVIHNFVAGGGSYLGVCLGAYLASSDNLNLFKGKIRAHSKAIEARMEIVSWHDRLRSVYFQDGPEFMANDGDDSDIWSFYETGEVAALIQNYKSGHVGLVGPHLEADQSWLDDDHLSDIDGDDSALLVEFIKSIEQSKLISSKK